MGHSINAIIGNKQALSKLASRLGPPEPVELAFGLEIIPLDEERLDAIAMSEEAAIDQFTYLHPTMVREIGRAVSSGRALYLETEYFGGMGGQCAALFEDGVLTWSRPESTFEPVRRPSLIARFFKTYSTPKKSPISEGLAKLGVVPDAGKDEFDQIGLGRFRSLEDLGLLYPD